MIFRNPELFKLDILQECARLCKRLIKINQIFGKERKTAIAMIRSKDKQEAFFIENSMSSDLAGLYVDQSRHADHFDLLVRMVRLQDALTVAIDHQLVAPDASIAEASWLRVVQYACIGDTAFWRCDTARDYSFCLQEFEEVKIKCDRHGRNTGGVDSNTPK